jgi:hypothetical protein
MIDGRSRGFATARIPAGITRQIGNDVGEVAICARVVARSSTLLPSVWTRAFGDPEIFRHPLVYMSEPGFWDMTDGDAANLRQYLLKGGLILFDDFETTQWNNMAAQMRRVLPELQWVTIDVMHPVFHTFFDLKKIDYDHPMFPGMVPVYKALFERNDPNGRMMALANHNNDLAEYWEWSDRGYFGIDPTNEAYRIGVNYVIYSLTH